MMLLRSLSLVSLLSLVLVPVAARAASADPAVEGIPNFHQVDSRLFRGGQPLPAAWPGLATIGVRTVIDLRQASEHSTADEKRAVEAAGMRYVSFPMNGFDTPTASQISEVLGLVGANDTVFVHCKLGCDRTGTVVAAYRMARAQWTNERALDEAQAMGLHWYEHGMKRFLRSYRIADAPTAALAQAPAAMATAAGNR